MEELKRQRRKEGEREELAKQERSNTERER